MPVHCSKRPQPHSSLIRSSALLGFIVSLACATLVNAQTRVSVRPAPKPGEVIHVTTQQEILLRVGEKPEEPGPAVLDSHNVLAFTQTNGTFDDRGRMNVQIVIDRLEINQTFGIQQKQPPDPSALKGRSVDVTLDRTGKLVGLKLPSDLSDVSAPLAQLLAGAFGIMNFVPTAELAVGQDTTTESELPMRLPGAGSSPMEARTTVTLRAIDRTAGERIARLVDTIQVGTSSAQLKVSGGGTIDVNLDRGFVSGTETEWKLSGTIPTVAGAAPSPPFFGSIKIRLSAN
jgi:hypothetical protein